MHNFFIHQALVVGGKADHLLLRCIQGEANVFVCIKHTVLFEDVKMVIKNMHKHHGQDTWVKGHPTSGQTKTESSDL